MKYFTMLLFYSALLYFTGQVIGYNIDLKRAHEDIDKLRKYLNSKDKSDTEEVDQKFAQLLDSFKEDVEKKILFSQIVPMYLKMLNSVKDAEMKDSITSLSQMLYQTNESFLKPTDEKLKHLLRQEKEMQMSDIKIQRSAIKELLRILKAVDELQHPRKPNPPKCKRESRRRRGC